MAERVWFSLPRALVLLHSSLPPLLPPPPLEVVQFREFGRSAGLIGWGIYLPAHGKNSLLDSEGNGLSYSSMCEFSNLLCLGSLLSQLSLEFAPPVATGIHS